MTSTVMDSKELRKLAACIVSLRDLVRLLEEPPEAHPVEMAETVERAKAALRELEAPNPDGNLRPEGNLRTEGGR